LNKSRQSPQYLAVLRGNKEILNRLLEISFPADKPLPQQFIGNSPLHAAVQKRDPGIPSLLYIFFFLFTYGILIKHTCFINLMSWVYKFEPGALVFFLYKF